MLIEGYLDRIRTDENTYLSAKSESDFQMLSRNLSVIRNLNDQMNDLVLLENQKFELNYQKVNLAQFIREVAHLFQPKAETEGKTLKYKSNVSDKVVVHLDEHQFSRVLYNILNNAPQLHAGGWDNPRHPANAQDRRRIHTGDLQYR